MPQPSPARARSGHSNMRPATRRAACAATTPRRARSTERPAERCWSAALIAASRALGAPGSAAGALEERLTALRRAPRPELVVTEADVLLSDAMALLGRARAALPVSATEAAALLEAARERGLSPTRGERGIELRGAPLERPTAAGLRQVAALLNAHPQGGVQILMVGPVAQRSAGRRRAASLRAGLLAGGVPPERLSVVEITVDVETPGLGLLLPAY